MLILGIETSCDETSVAVVRGGVEVLSCVISSSKNDFQGSGGVIPEEAARRQLEVMLPVMEKALSDAHVNGEDLDAIAVTSGPGLLGSLLVGTTTARTLSTVWKKPLIPIHHTLGHLSSTWLGSDTGQDAPRFPVLTLSVSGGHTDLWFRKSHTRGILAGSTLDDAAGEAFDKGAVQLGLPYPGGPALSKLAEKGNADAYSFPAPLAGDSGLNFSFSGLKTSLKYLLRDLGGLPEDMEKRSDIAAGYENAICRHLSAKLSAALERFPDTREIHLVGGVSANTRLRRFVADLGASHGITVRWPQTLRYCTDNGAMIAAAGEFLVLERPEMLGATMTTNGSVRLETQLQA